jgi:hypothetical protein
MEKTNGRDYSSPYNFQVRNGQISKEIQIGIEEMGLVTEELSDCVRRENVNQFVNCRELREKYFLLCQDRLRGALIPPDAKVYSRNLPGIVPLDMKSHDPKK